MDPKTKFIVGICGFLTSMSALLGTLEHGWADARSPSFIAAILGLLASFILTAYGGAGFTPAKVQEAMVGRAIERVHEQLDAQQRDGTTTRQAAGTLRLAATQAVADVAASQQQATPPHSYFVIEDGLAKRLTQEGFERVLKAAGQDLPAPLE